MLKTLGNKLFKVGIILVIKLVLLWPFNTNVFFQFYKLT